MHPLEFRVVDLPGASLHTTAVLVLGQHRAVLVGAGLRLSDGRRLVREVERSGRRLGAVLVPHHAPEWWLAAEVLRDAFPEARLLAPAPVRARIEDDYPAVRAAWAGLGEELPSRLVALEPLEGDAVELEDRRLELRGASLGLPDHHYLWEHRSRTLLGGPLLWQDVHPWLAEVPQAAQREAWIGLLDEMADLEPLRTVAGHRHLTTPATAPPPDPVAWTGDYLRAFATELGKPVGPDEVAAALLHRYPSAALPSAVGPAVRTAREEPAAA
ncbi:MBL fold metallo-hydrolase [Kitasatospora sp. YST-16]|uniref:MBL fold metallo-hydrolase n=1 Tax=Kitasatospora sp. YST-16 TaxID=2998080 RepID=UPI002284AB4C|nr:MBL fold metallo-hydrolase [Kitasatospora sp. YST-16]WAL74480.1 MBL fold metallo-hydrolase [Kitasatospora sp. YST-16]WNW40547.1 MBL fold metallo-hydrolase [Streptomyces sp. Li-HN-5-13]